MLKSAIFSLYVLTLKIGPLKLNLIDHPESKYYKRYNLNLVRLGLQKIIKIESPNYLID